MGAVKQETRNEGRGLHEYDYVCLGETRVVAQLIRNRSKLDAAYQIKGETCVCFVSTGVCELLEPILCLYVDLDRLIERCGLSGQQREIVEKVMMGYTMGDLSCLWNKPRQAIDLQYQRAVAKIAKQNDLDWYRLHEKRAGI